MGGIKKDIEEEENKCRNKIIDGLAQYRNNK